MAVAELDNCMINSYSMTVLAFVSGLFDNQGVTVSLLNDLVDTV